jgi:hypothetical protein
MKNMSKKIPIPGKLREEYRDVTATRDKEIK